MPNPTEKEKGGLQKKKARSYTDRNANRPEPRDGLLEWRDLKNTTD